MKLSSSHFSAMATGSLSVVGACVFAAGGIVAGALGHGAVEHASALALRSLRRDHTLAIATPKPERV